MTNSFEGLRNVSVNGTQLAYHEQGSGDPVLFVHGSSSDLRTWERQIPAIGAQFRAIAYSRRYARPNADIEPSVESVGHTTPQEHSNGNETRSEGL